MKIAIYGAGAMGCLIGGLCARAGYDVTFIARGKQHDALQRKGLTLITGNERWNGKVKVFEHPRDAGSTDVVMLTTKAHQLPTIAPNIAPLLHDDTIIMPSVNGVPWWYFQCHGGPYDGRTLKSVDPDGTLTKYIDAKRIIGSVNYLAGTLVEPGVVEYMPKYQFTIGELTRTITPRVQQLGAVFQKAGLEVKVTETIREDIWHKVWGNSAFNPIGALTHGTMAQLARDYHDLDLVLSVMNETRIISEALDIAIPQTPKARVEMASKIGYHKTSMQQDIEAGRPTEIDAIIGAVREIGLWIEMPTPYLNALYSLVKMKEQFYRPDGAGHVTLPARKDAAAS
ncbi:MAG: 2-dehydropantoate 2-reductase [Alphaproteobacteria bacterium]|nr:2-dehydropantoate 2-reductase [Alphaproteobacteria bacterium]